MDIKQHHKELNYEAIFQQMIDFHKGIDWNETIYWLNHDTTELHSFVGVGNVNDSYRIVDAIHEVDRRQDFHKLLGKASKLLILIEKPTNLSIDMREFKILNYYLNAYADEMEINFDVYQREGIDHNIMLHFILAVESCK